MSLLAVQDLALAHGRRAVLGQVSCALGPGELVAVVGRNGSGKSTLLRALAGLQPPRRGRIVLAGRPLHDLPAPERARHLAFLPQDRLIHWSLPVRDVVLLGRTPHRTAFGPPSADDVRIVEEEVSRLGLATLAGRPADQLSGGERARVLLARALAQRTEVLVADEPTAGLDPAQELRVMEILAGRAREGSLVLVALHDLSLVCRWCSRVLMLHDGGLVADGPPAEVMTPAQLREIYGVDFALSVSGGMPFVLPLRPSAA